METIWIAGMGRFGLRALRQLSEQQKERKFVLIDQVREKLEPGKGANCTLEQADGVDFLEHNLRPGDEPDWIIPALPLHLAAEWCLRRLGPKRFRREPSLPPDMDLLLPNPMRGSSGDIYVSHASFRCPDNCCEPADICTVTRIPRKQNMFDLLEQLCVPSFESLMIRSHQLAAGVGGYRGKQLFLLLRQAETAKGDLLISTACRCHGVMTGMINQSVIRN
ncbi:MAG: potassium transporter [Desulfobacteraceae bacterium]|nr:MAG: potassium transporter [Desulfobacteraceae bacterium]